MPDPTLDVWVPAFVGRARELEALAAALGAVQAGESRIVLIAGEPGIGKTRLVTESLAAARRQDLRVLTCRCWEGGGAPAFWPWVQLFRGIVEDPAAERVLAALGPAAGDLVRLLPEIEWLMRTPPTPPGLDAEQARFRMFETVLLLLKAAAGERPTVLSVDDLHAADAPSLQLLRFVAAHLTFPGLLLVACYRDTEVVVAETFQLTLTALTRVPQCKRVSLTGLAPGDVGAVLGEALGMTPSAAVVEALHARTDGNALFVTELTRALVERGEVGAAALRAVVERVPPSLRDIVGARLAELSAGSRTVIEAAAVAGREFDVSSLSAVVGTEAAEVFAALDHATRLGMIAALPEAADRFRFAHALIHDCVYAGVGPQARLAFHRGFAAALAAQHGDADGPHLAAIAHHYRAAGAAPDRREAFAYMFRAGAHARRILAFEDAAAHFTWALELAAADEPRRCEVLFALVDAQRNAGQPDAARQTAQQLLEIARTTGAPEFCARAALAFAGPPMLGQPDADAIPVIEWALARMAGVESPTHVRLLARLVSALSVAQAQERRAALARTALDMAVRLGDVEGHAAAILAAHHAPWLAPRSGRIVEAIDAIIENAARAGQPEVEAHVQVARFAFLIRSGDVAAAAATAARSAVLAKALRQPRFSWQTLSMHATLALVEGRFAVANRHAEAAQALGLGGNIPLAEFHHVAHMIGIRREVGGVERVRNDVRGLAERHPDMCVWNMALLFVDAESGRLDRVRRALGELSIDKIATNFYWLLSCGLAAEAIARVRETSIAPSLYDALLPFDGQILTVAAAAYLGPVSRHLGLLATVTGRYEVAARHLTAAVETAARMGATPMVARIQYERAVMCVQAGHSPGDSQVVAFVDEAEAVARRLRMRPLMRRIRELRRIKAGGRSSVVRTAVTTTATSHAATENEALVQQGSDRHFRREGDAWILGGAEHSFRLRDTKGLRYLAWLIRSPRQDVHVLDLVAAASGTSRRDDGGRIRTLAADGLRFDGGAVGPAIDERARCAYRHRLRELREALGEARTNGDLGRMNALQEEVEYLGRHLDCGGAVAGRSPRTGSAVERARVSVRNAITKALARIARHDTRLWRHLANSVRTGTFCSYEPEHPVRWHF